MTWGETATTQVKGKKTTRKQSRCFALTSIELLDFAVIKRRLFVVISSCILTPYRNSLLAFQIFQRTFNRIKIWFFCKLIKQFSVSYAINYQNSVVSGIGQSDDVGENCHISAIPPRNIICSRIFFTASDSQQVKISLIVSFCLSRLIDKDKLVCNGQR